MPEIQSTKPARCRWFYDPDEDVWVSACGVKFVLNDGTPAENGMRYCLQCGRKLAK